MKFRYEENVRTKSNKLTVQYKKNKNSITQEREGFLFLLSLSCTVVWLKYGLSVVKFSSQAQPLLEKTLVGR